MDKQRLIQQLILDEGLKLFPYKDTVGKLTIGVGRNLDDKGITKQEALMLLENDILEVEKQLNKFDWFKILDSVRQEVIVNMVFNVGLSRFLQFKKMILALQNKDFNTASEEMLNSKWAEQVKQRAVRLAKQMKTGQN